MMRIDYQPGGAAQWLAVIAAPRMLVVRGGGLDPVELHRLLAETNSAAPLLELLTTNGLSSTPAFALLEGGVEKLRVIARGVDVAVVTDTAFHTVHGRGAATWAEQLFVGWRTAEIGIDGAASHSVLPLLGGSAWVSAVQVRVGAEVAGDTEEQGEPQEGTTAAPRREALRSDHDSKVTEIAVIPRDARAAPAPVRSIVRHWQLEFADGQAHRIQTPIVVGRNPVATPAHADDLLVPLSDPRRSVSKTHARFFLQDGRLMLLDLHSTNGVSIGHDYLEPGVPTVIPTEALVRLGDFEVRVLHAPDAG